MFDAFLMLGTESKTFCSSLLPVEKPVDIFTLKKKKKFIFIGINIWVTQSVINV